MSIEKVRLAGNLFMGSREFLLAWRVLDLYSDFGQADEGRRTGPLFGSRAVCAGLSLELALKCRIVLDGRTPPAKGAKGHDYVILFTTLSQDAQHEVAARVRLRPDGRQATAAELVDVLKLFQGTFVEFRYLHELPPGSSKTFHTGDIWNVLLALHDSTIQLRPDLGPWNGVIWDHEKTTAANQLGKVTAAYRLALGLL
jgi:hypothetical protein